MKKMKKYYNENSTIYITCGGGGVKIMLFQKD